MLIDLQKLVQDETKKESHRIEPEMKTFKLGTTEYEIDNGFVDVSFRNTGKKHIYFEASGSVMMKIPCDRCLEDVDYKIDIDYSKDMDMNKTSEERIAELDEISYLDKTIFDSEVFIYNEILVNLPMKVLCSENCKGICNRCGANLNKGSCNCDAAELDPRMSKILDVFNQFKEV